MHKQDNRAIDQDSPSNLSPDSINLQAEQIYFLYSNIKTALIVNVSIAILFISVLYNRVESDALLYWASTLMLILLLRVINLFQFNKTHPGNDRLQIWVLRYAITTGLSGLAWGLSIWVFQPYPNLETPILIAFTLGGLTAGAAAVIGAMLSVYSLYVLACMLPLTFWFFIQASDTYLIMAIMLCVYILAMIAGGYTYQKVMLKSFLLSRQLITARDEAEKANHAKSVFLARMSHELRTPLNAIMGFTQILLNKNKTSDSGKDYLKEIMKASSMLLKLIEDLLDLSSIEENIIDLKLKPHNSHDIIIQCIDSIQPLANKQNIQIHFDSEASKEFTLLADELRLKQVLLNLLSNACKYNKPNGQINIKLQAQGNNRVRISISDTGIGIPRDKQADLFKLYQRLGLEQTPVKGTGLGLNIARKLAELMDGDISFESIPGEGSTFHVDLPIVEQVVTET